MNGHVDTLRTIISFYRLDARQLGDAASMLQLRQAQLGDDSLDALAEENRRLRDALSDLNSLTFEDEADERCVRKVIRTALGDS